MARAIAHDGKGREEVGSEVLVSLSCVGSNPNKFTVSSRSWAFLYSIGWPELAICHIACLPNAGIREACA